MADARSRKRSLLVLLLAITATFLAMMRDFLLAILLSPIALIVPSAATAPALVLVGYLMFTLVRDIPVADVEEGLPALLTMILMPLTYDITVGIGAGFISWVLIKLVRGKMAEIHWLMWVVSIAFLVFFAQDWINGLL